MASFRHPVMCNYRTANVILLPSCSWNYQDAGEEHTTPDIFVLLWLATESERINK